MPDLAVVIVSYETRERTLACARSVLADAAASDLDVTIAVVDNASRDGSGAAVEDELGNQVTLLASPRNLGFGAACNQGAELWPRAKHLLFLNGDTELQSGAFDALIAAFRADAEIGVAGPALVEDDGAPQSSVRGHPTSLALLHQHTALRFLRFGASAYAAYKTPFASHPTEDADVDVVMGAALAVRGETFRALGGFDARYFLYFEEADLCRRVALFGQRVRFVAAATVRHAGGASSDHDGARALVWYVESLFRYVDRFHGRGTGLLYRVLFKPLFLLRLLTDAVRDALTYVARPSKRAAKGAELRLALGFCVRGIWRFAVS